MRKTAADPLAWVDADPALATAIAAALRPRARVRPSEWAAANVVLSEDFAARPGPFDPDWKPWIRAVLDCTYNEPAKKGFIGIKPSQVGWSLAMTILLICMIATDPAPILYITTDGAQAKKFADTYFGKIVAKIGWLRDMLAACAKRETEGTLHKPFDGGFLDWYGAGTESGALSFPRREVFLDEYQKSAENFPTASGDLFTTALGRVKTFEDTWHVNAFGHPRFEGEDIAGLYAELSDQRPWVFDCPHCGKVVEPCSDRIDWRGLVEGDPNARRDPAKAVFTCPHCAREIADRDRARAVWHPGRGGSGRFESELPAEVAKTREWIGLKLNRLADPHVSVYEIAKEWAGCGQDEGRLQSFFNKTLGEVRRKARGFLTLASIEKSIERPERILVPGGELGVKFVVAGADVQAPKESPTTYNAHVAFAATGLRYVTYLGRENGFARWHQTLREGAVELADAAGNPTGQRIGLRVAGIDATYETGQVLDACREPLAVYQAENGGLVKRLPFRVVPHLHADNPAVDAPERKRFKPGRPDLGLLEYKWVHRHSWVDRVVKALQQGQYRFLCPLPEEFAAHLMSNQLRPVAKQHGLDRDREEWELPKGYRDDWLWALIAAEIAAVLECGLDQIYALASTPEHREVPATPEERDEARRGWMDSYRRGGSWFGR